ncbi:TonB family protein [uncultured Ruegeria sp.]|uniref:energy transducer TonB family protein n=1 Tax=uncultured Ruegeria sp. TaxID=259304 RepID=UPI00344EA06C
MRQAPVAIAALAPDEAPQPETTPSTAKPQDPAPKAATQPPPKPAASSREQVPEKAKGQAQAAAGSGEVEQETTGNTKKQANLRKQWGAQILSRIERQKRNQSGTGDVRLKLVVHTSGKLQSVSLVRSSQNPKLDATAMSIAKRAKPPRAPRRLLAGSYPFVVTISFGR